MVVIDIFKHVESDTHLELVDKKGRLVWSGYSPKIPGDYMEKWVDTIAPADDEYGTLIIKLDWESVIE